MTISFLSRELFKTMTVLNLDRKYKNVLKNTPLIKKKQRGKGDNLIIYLIIMIKEYKYYIHI